MSQFEFETAQKQLLALTRQMADECTQENYDRVIERLVKLKTDGILNKVYWALCIVPLPRSTRRKLPTL